MVELMAEAKRTPAKGRTPTDTRKQESVQEFLDQFANALTAGDGRTIATMWETPALVISDQNVMAVTSRQEVEQFFSGAKELYNRMGIADTRAEIVRLDWATDRIAMVEVRWPYLDAQNHEVGEESSTYTLRRDDQGDLKLRAVAMHGSVAPDGSKSGTPEIREAVTEPARRPSQDWN
jgi:ketosteroid isomerase-like protein